MKARERIDGLILGGTELSLIFREPTGRGPAGFGYDADSRGRRDRRLLQA